jgi:cytosine deaminase/N-isopropylammelide isopropylaminohydrolase
MEACIRARERTSEIADVQLVPWSAHGILHEDNVEKMREAIQMGLDAGGDILVGGVDPGTRNYDVERTIDAWLDLAEEFDIKLDPHIQDGGTLGTYTLDRLLDKADERGFEDRITASHCFCLANVKEWRVNEMIERFEETGTGVVTCYSSTRCSMPLRSLIESGAPVAHGTDNDQDFVALHGRTDSIEGLIVETNKLHGDATFDEEYRWFQTNDGLAALWNMLTEQGADVMDLENYGVEEGNRADLVVLDEPSSQWAIVDHASRRYVVKDGSVVAEDEELTTEYSEL